MPSGMKPDGPVGPDVWDLGETESQMGALNSMVVILGDLGHCLVGTHSCENRDAELKVRALSWGQLLRGSGAPQSCAPEEESASAEKRPRNSNQLIFLHLLEAAKGQVLFQSADTQRNFSSGYRSSSERDPGLLHHQSAKDALLINRHVKSA